MAVYVAVGFRRIGISLSTFLKTLPWALQFPGRSGLLPGCHLFIRESSSPDVSVAGVLDRPQVTSVTTSMTYVCALATWGLPS